MLVGECSELSLQEREAQCVLESLNLGVSSEVALPEDVLDPGHGGVVVAHAAEDLRSDVRVELLQLLAPAEVARAVLRVALPRDLPTPDVVGAGREQERMTGFGAEAADPLGDELRVGELLGSEFAAHFEAVRIVSVGGVDGGQGGFQPARPGSGCAGSGRRSGLTHVFSSSAARSGWPRATRNMTLLPAA